MKMKNLRWWVIGLIALATIINYIDRQSLNVLWPVISAEMYPDKTPDERKEIYAFISLVFVFSYAFGQAIFGKIFDWVGTRVGFALSIGIWSLFILWIPIYLSEVFGMDLKTIGLYGWVPYVGAMFGAWFGGLLAQNRLRSGWTVDRTRKFTITLGCVMMLPALLAMSNPGAPIHAVLLMALILFGFQTAIGNVQTLPSDFYGGKLLVPSQGWQGWLQNLAQRR